MAIQSFMSVYVEAMRPLFGDPAKEEAIITGSGFVLEHAEEFFLITNGHIVTGRDRLTEKPLGRASLPRTLRVKIPVEGPEVESGMALLGTQTMTLDLYDDQGRALWFSHPHAGLKFDVVALPLVKPARRFPDLIGSYLPYHFSNDAPDLAPPDELSVVGFPFGLHGGVSTAVWVRGSVATEPDFLYQGEPCFLIDARTREGQSGSPVIQRRIAGDSASSDYHLRGVYSSRVNPAETSKSSDLGRVWTSDVIAQILEGQSLGEVVYE